MRIREILNKVKQGKIKPSEAYNLFKNKLLLLNNNCAVCIFCGKATVLNMLHELSIKNRITVNEAEEEILFIKEHRKKHQLLAHT